MARLDVFATFPDGSPAANQLVSVNSFDAQDWGKAGMTLNPNPRLTSGDGGVNFYSGGPLGQPVMVQAFAQNGTSEPTYFDGTQDVAIGLTIVPFA